MRTLMALSAFVACGLHAEVKPSIAVFTNFESQPSERSVDAMKKEVEALLGSSGLRLDWRSLANRDASESFSDLYVFRFRGQCNVQKIQLLFSELGPYGETVILGEAKTTDSTIQPFGSVACDPIRKSIAPKVLGMAYPEREEAFGRALGRVMAHELFHMMTGISRHAGKGVFKASQRAEDLTGRSYSFEPQERAELRRFAQRLAIR